MPTVVGVFPNTQVAAAAFARLAAEAAPDARCVLFSGAPAGPATAGAVRPRRAAAGDRIQNAGEAAAAGGLCGVLAAGVLLFLPTLAALALGDAGVVEAALLAAGAAGSRIGRRFGLARDLAHRYTIQLRRGRAVVGVAASPTQAAVVSKFLTQAGAADVRVCQGRLRLLGSARNAAADMAVGGVSQP
ncbi:MAG: hypothetical protein NTZ05_22305 [Chloroflexi bacterium]|nr:hypothetical protein [Chloroflexota bacterium]